MAFSAVLFPNTGWPINTGIARPSNKSMVRSKLAHRLLAAWAISTWGELFPKSTFSALNRFFKALNSLLSRSVDKRNKSFSMREKKFIVHNLSHIYLCSTVSKIKSLWTCSRYMCKEIIIVINIQQILPWVSWGATVRSIKAWFWLHLSVGAFSSHPFQGLMCFKKNSREPGILFLWGKLSFSSHPGANTTRETPGTESTALHA